jgi:hypothetical protein
MMRCPVCRAEVEQGPNCRRCRADLSLVFTLQAQRAEVLAVARAALAEGRLSQALAAAEGAETLRAGPDARRVQALVWLLRGDFPRAWECYREASEA